MKNYITFYNYLIIFRNSIRFYRFTFHENDENSIIYLNTKTKHNVCQLHQVKRNNDRKHNDFHLHLILLYKNRLLNV